MESSQRSSRYTAKCVYCARIVFRDARRLGDIQVRMIQSHVLICRPLAVIGNEPDLLGHIKIIETAA